MSLDLKYEEGRVMISQKWRHILERGNVHIRESVGL